MNYVLLAAGNTSPNKLPLQCALHLAIQKHAQKWNIVSEVLQQAVKGYNKPTQQIPTFAIFWLAQAYTPRIWAPSLQMLYSVKSRGAIAAVNLVSVVLCFPMQRSGQCFLLSENTWVELPTWSRKSALAGACRMRTLLFSHPGCA